MTLRDYFARLVDAFREKDAVPSSALVLPAVPTGLSRRSFLGFMAAATVGAAVIDVDKLVWTPGEKTLFLPPPVDLFDVADMAGATRGGFITTDWVTKEALRCLTNHLSFGKQVNRLYDAPPDNRVGDTVQVRVPQAFIALKAEAMLPAVISESVKTVVLDQQCVVEISRLELARCRTKEEAINRVIKPATGALAHMLERGKINLFAKLPNPIGLTSTVMSSPKDGVSIRGMNIEDYAHGTDVFRLDVLGGKA